MASKVIFHIQHKNSRSRIEEKAEKNPIDTHYEKLKTNISVLGQDEDEFAIIDEYVKTTHAKTHQDYSLEINNVFKIDRNKEAKKYKVIDNGMRRFG